MVSADSRRRLMIATAGLAALVALLALGSLGTGPVRLSPLTVIDALLGVGTEVHQIIVREIRLPRMILGLAIGAILGLSGAALQGLDEEDVEAVANGNANVRNLRVVSHPNPVTKGWRVTLDFERVDTKQPVELRAFLRTGSRTLSETWSYALPPE